MWCLMPRGKVTSGFFRIQMLLAIGLSMLAILTMGQLRSTVGELLTANLLLSARLATGMALVSAYVGSVFWLLDRRRIGTYAIVGVVIGMVVSLICTHGGLSGLSNHAEAFHFASSLATAAVLGSAVTGMLLGHWYLTAPTMSIEPLKRLCRYFGIALLVRLTVSVAGWFLMGQPLQGGVQWTWFALRWLAGIIGPLVIAVMALQILKYRNTQAATGVLFAGVILTFIGEMSASLLYSELHTPL